jgi:hypothetical protein
MFRNNTLNTRRETTDIWQSQNPLLDEMELGVEIVLNADRKPLYYNIKLGNGISRWNSLSYFYKNLNEEDANEILDDFTINLATRKPVADRIPIYNDNNTLKSAAPMDSDDVARLEDFDGINADVVQLETDVSSLTDSFNTHIQSTTAHSATDTPTANKIAMYNNDSGLKSGKIATENNDVMRLLEFNNEVSDINSKISTLNGAYYVLDAYDFGKTLDETDPADILILNTYAIANTPNASSMDDVYNDTVIINEFDTSEFVYNKISELWVKYPNGYLTTATNDHLGVVKGTPVPTDPTEASNSKDISVRPDGTMYLIGESGKVDSVDGVIPNSNKDIELTIEMTRAEHDSYEDPPGSGKYPALAGKTVTLSDVYPSGCPFPVGSLYMSVDSRNPSEFWAGTTWSVWGSGRVPVGFDSTQTEFDTVEKTDGEKVHTLSTSEMPSHNHTLGNALSVGQSAPGFAGATIGQGITTISATGGGAAHNNLQPYIVCYMWKRDS